MIQLPPTLLAEVDALVASGVFASREVAVAELLRLGLQALRMRPRPPLPPEPPMIRDPLGDEPISVDPKRDVNWV